MVRLDCREHFTIHKIQAFIVFNNLRVIRMFKGCYNLEKKKKKKNSEKIHNNKETFSKFLQELYQHFHHIFISFSH